MVATMKLLHIPLNLLNVLAFRLVLAVGVDYGIYVILVWQKARELEHDVAGVVKPVILAGLTAVAGFGALGLANNPTLGGLGIACAIGIFWSLAATVFFALPAAAAAEPKIWREETTPISRPTTRPCLKQHSSSTSLSSSPARSGGAARSRRRQNPSRPHPREARRRARRCRPISRKRRR